MLNKQQIKKSMLRTEIMNPFSTLKRHCREISFFHTVKRNI